MANSLLLLLVGFMMQSFDSTVTKDCTVRAYHRLPRSIVHPVCWQILHSFLEDHVPHMRDDNRVLYRQERGINCTDAQRRIAVARNHCQTLHTFEHSHIVTSHIDGRQMDSIHSVNCAYQVQAVLLVKVAWLVVTRIRIVVLDAFTCTLGTHLVD